MKYGQKTFSVPLGGEKYANNWARAFGLCEGCEKKPDECACETTPIEESDILEEEPAS